MAREFKQTTRERMERASASSLSAAEINTVVRRLGFVLLRAMEVIESRLIADQDQQFAEHVRDMIKPVVDYMIHFELADLEVDRG